MQKNQATKTSRILYQGIALDHRPGAHLHGEGIQILIETGKRQPDCFIPFSDPAPKTRNLILKLLDIFMMCCDIDFLDFMYEINGAPSGPMVTAFGISGEHDPDTSLEIRPRLEGVDSLRK